MTNDLPPPLQSAPKKLSSAETSNFSGLQANDEPAAFEEFQELPPAEPESPIPEAVTRRHWAVRDLILDYALGNAIIGLNPIPGTVRLTLLLGAILVLMMMRHIGKKWGYAGGQDLLAVLGNVFGGIGACAIAFMSWLTLFTIGLFFPVIRLFDISAALFTFTWMVGQVTHQYYLNGRLKRELL